MLVSTSGERLLDDDGVRGLCAELIPLARVITPNLAEAEVLSGMRIASLDQACEAARRIHEMGAAAVVITGGHATWTTTGPDSDDTAQQADVVTDLPFDGQAFHEFRTRRIDSHRTHGTGCTFAAAITANLALGRSLSDAAERAQHYAMQPRLLMLRQSAWAGGPLDHFWGGILKG